MNDPYFDYWLEAVGEALEVAKVKATEDQIKEVAEFMQCSYDCIGMAFGHEHIPNPLKEENKKLKEQLNKEKDKVSCDKCNGTGDTIIVGVRTSISSCYKCNGTGKIFYWERK